MSRTSLPTTRRMQQQQQQQHSNTTTTTSTTTTSTTTTSRSNKSQSIRHLVTFTDRRFDVATLPADLRRVYQHLSADFGDEYALTVVFVVRTAVELHRAWHVTLLTAKILRQIGDRFGLRMTWNLGVSSLRFRVEDGRFELHRKVPYDYDSEFQDLYGKIAVALVEGHITIHEALLFQSETKQGKHTAKSGLFLRANPGRLLLYPVEAATCAVIFFGGDWTDAGVAAVCGLAAGLVEYALGTAAKRVEGAADATILVDVLVGITTGIITGLFHRFAGSGDGSGSGDDGIQLCLSSIFLGTLYWFFYGTAFVIGLLEIIAGELETGVTRFIAVSVKTFVLTLGSTIGLQMVLDTSVFDAWTDSYAQCGTIDLDDQWWRIPLYLLCSASALGQYRFPIANYWRGLTVQLVAYEVQYQTFRYFAEQHDRDFLDTASSNIAGAMAAVATASTLSYLVDQLGYYYNARLLQRDQPSHHHHDNGGDHGDHDGDNNNNSSNSIANNKNRQQFSKFGNLAYNANVSWVRLVHCLGLGKQSSLDFLRMQAALQKNTAELSDPHHPRTEIRLLPEEEAALVEAIVEAETLNIWSLLMPAVYQLVPGSLIARLWYNAVFPPPPVETAITIPGTNFTYTDTAANKEADDVFYGLMVISTSLALGLLLGFAFVFAVGRILTAFLSMFTSSSSCNGEEQTREEKEQTEARQKRKMFRQQGVLQLDCGDDPEDGPGEQFGREGGDADPAVMWKGDGGVASQMASDTEGASLRFRPLMQGMMPVSEKEENESSNNNSSSKHMIAAPTNSDVQLQMEKADEETGYEVTKNV